MKQTPFIVTIDGPAGVGKSTLAKRLAESLDISYLDTGAMFRILALALAPFVEEGTENQASALVFTHQMQQALKAFVFTLEGKGCATVLLCNKHPIGDEIRTEEAARMAAKFAQVPQVREYLKQAQKKMAEEFSFVAEGRDMGTEVFPQAPIKFFLEARAEVRAKRRFNQLQELGKPANMEELVVQITERDYQDRTRAIAPLLPASDAHILDTSDMTLEQVLAAMMHLVRKESV